MAKADRKSTVPEPGRLPDSKKRKLDKLLKKRESLTSELEQVERQVRELQGNDGSAGSKSLAASRRSRNPVPLPAVVADILGRSRKGLTLRELTDKVLESGYKSTSSNFKNVVYQCLYNSDKFTHDHKTGTYRLQKQQVKK